MEQRAYQDVFRNRIQRGGPRSGGGYSTQKIGAVGANLAAVACFFTHLWQTPSPKLRRTDQSNLLRQAAFFLRALGRLTEIPLERMRAELRNAVSQKKWKEAAIIGGHLCEIQLELGNVAGAIADGDQAVIFADRGREPTQQRGQRVYYANALNQAGRRTEVDYFFREVQDLEPKGRPKRNKFRGDVEHLEFLLADVERTAWQVTMDVVAFARPDQDTKKPTANRKHAVTFQNHFPIVCKEVAQQAQGALRSDHLTLLLRGRYREFLARTELNSCLVDASSEL